jgi:hypothetical protein
MALNPAAPLGIPPAPVDDGRIRNLRRALVLYRMVFGQNRQEDLVNYLASRLPAAAVSRMLDLCRIDLSPPNDGED